MIHRLAASPSTVRAGRFSAAFPPVITISSGDSIEIESVSGRMELLPDTSWGYELPEALRAIIAANPEYLGPHLVTGPVAVSGAEPGDTLEVRIERIAGGADWGFTYIRPLVGALPGEFDAFTLFHTRVDRERGICLPPWGGELPFQPFFGVMGVAPPPHYGTISTKEPRIHGGNIDNKELVAGSRLYLPVHVVGANFSVGDGHGRQGDGEVCVTALEMCLTGVFTLIVHKRGAMPEGDVDFPWAETPTHILTMGFNADLDAAVTQALRTMLDIVTRRSALSREESYAFCSLAVDFRVTQVVNGEKGVHAMLDKTLLSQLSPRAAPPVNL